nr:retrotransposon protein, putative, Ty1-copia subclass [Tanacetum cinerariifolium]
MTTSSTNNSVFRGFFKKQKLIGPNFIDWYRQLRIVLSIKDKLNYLEQRIPHAPVALAGQQVAPEILAAHTAWQAEHELLQTTRDFHSCRQKEGQSVSSYVLKMKGYIDNLERLGHPVTLGLGQQKSQAGLGLCSLVALSTWTYNNKRAKLDLDSALLWHCRLGHISKKRIEKLQHDGLLNSSDLTAFEKCVSCMSEKMARKPYTHQVERTKDLLGLIHTDVCGPFKIMSRQGASYFVTFTDDFSRYGYVYLLKHKHEVFETFKVFQKEVEKQLGKTIKSLRSDRGGEYTSQEFLDHLKDHGIIAHLWFIAILGYIASFRGLPVESVKQSIFATSSAEAEYIAAFDASKEAVWVRKFFSGLGVVPTIEEPISMYCDNTGAIAIANESGIRKGARHFRAKVHYLREVIEFGDIKLEKVYTYDNLADPFTKALAFPKNYEHTKNIEMLPASSLM